MEANQAHQVMSHGFIIPVPIPLPADDFAEPLSGNIVYFPSQGPATAHDPCSSSSSTPAANGAVPDNTPQDAPAQASSAARPSPGFGAVALPPASTAAQPPAAAAPQPTAARSAAQQAALDAALARELVPEGTSNIRAKRTVLELLMAAARKGGIGIRSGDAPAAAAGPSSSTSSSAAPYSLRLDALDDQIKRIRPPLQMPTPLLLFLQQEDRLFKVNCAGSVSKSRMTVSLHDMLLPLLEEEDEPPAGAPHQPQAEAGQQQQLLYYVGDAGDPDAWWHAFEDYERGVADGDGSSGMPDVHTPRLPPADPELLRTLIPESSKHVRVKRYVLARLLGAHELWVQRRSGTPPPMGLNHLQEQLNNAEPPIMLSVPLLSVLQQELHLFRVQLNRSGAWCVQLRRHVVKQQQKLAAAAAAGASDAGVAAAPPQANGQLHREEAPGRLADPHATPLAQEMLPLPQQEAEEPEVLPLLLPQAVAYPQQETTAECAPAAQQQRQEQDRQPLPEARTALLPMPQPVVEAVPLEAVPLTSEAVPVPVPMPMVVPQPMPVPEPLPEATALEQAAMLAEGLQASPLRPLLMLVPQAVPMPALQAMPGPQAVPAPQCQWQELMQLPTQLPAQPPMHEGQEQVAAGHAATPVQQQYQQQHQHQQQVPPAASVVSQPPQLQPAASGAQERPHLPHSLLGASAAMPWMLGWAAGAGRSRGAGAGSSGGGGGCEALAVVPLAASRQQVELDVQREQQQQQASKALDADAAALHAPAGVTQLPKAEGQQEEQQQQQASVSAPPAETAAVLRAPPPGFVSTMHEPREQQLDAAASSAPAAATAFKAIPPGTPQTPPQHQDQVSASSAAAVATAAVRTPPPGFERPAQQPKQQQPAMSRHQSECGADVAAAAAGHGPTSAGGAAEPAAPVGRWLPTGARRAASASSNGSAAMTTAGPLCSPTAQRSGGSVVTTNWTEDDATEAARKVAGMLATVWTPAGCRHADHAPSSLSAGASLTSSSSRGAAATSDRQRMSAGQAATRNAGKGAARTAPGGAGAEPPQQLSQPQPQPQLLPAAETVLVDSQQRVPAMLQHCYSCTHVGLAVKAASGQPALVVVYAPPATEFVGAADEGSRGSGAGASEAGAGAGDCTAATAPVWPPAVYVIDSSAGGRLLDMLRPLLEHRGVAKVTHGSQQVLGPLRCALGPGLRVGPLLDTLVPLSLVSVALGGEPLAAPQAAPPEAHERHTVPAVAAKGRSNGAAGMASINSEVAALKVRLAACDGLWPEPVLGGVLGALGGKHWGWLAAQEQADSSKGSTWLVRPLGESQLQVAAQAAQHLPELWQLLCDAVPRATLAACQRLEQQQ